MSVDWKCEAKKLNNKIHVIPSERSKQFIENFNKNKPTKEFIESCKKAGELFGEENDKSTEQNVADIPSVSIQPKTIANDCDLISRADAIEAIQNAYCKPCKERGDDYNKVRCRACEYDNAIMQIDALPSADVVSREEYNKLLNDSIWQSEHIKKMFEYQTESADRPKGEWKVENHEVVCSVCGQNNLETNFCPCCGADMRGEK